MTTFESLSGVAILIFRRYFESSSLSVFCKIGILKTAKFLGKHICWSLFSIQLQTFILQNIYFKNTFFTGLFWATVSDI